MIVNCFDGTFHLTSFLVHAILIGGLKIETDENSEKGNVRNQVAVQFISAFPSASPLITGEF